MGKFGILKEKILKHMTESYSNKENDKMKNIITKMKSNKDFREVYMFYENFENKFIEDKNVRNTFINETEDLLRVKLNSIKDFQKDLEKDLSHVDIISENEIYSMLDDLTESKSLDNIDIKAKNKIKIDQFLSTPKKEMINVENSKSINENALVHVLTDNFNNKYSDFLSEDEIKIFNEIMELNENDLNQKFNSLKTETLNKLNTHFTDDETINERLESAKNKLLDENFISNKINYLKIIDLNNSL